MKQLLIEAGQKIKALRLENEILRARVETMDLFECILKTVPAVRREGAEVDIVWKIQNKIDELPDTKK